MQFSADFVDLKTNFDREGYCFLQGLLSSQELQDLRLHLDQAKSSLQKRSNLNTEGMTFSSNLYRESEALAALCCAPRLDQFLQQIAEQKVWIRWDQMIDKQPGGKEFPWHRDNAYNQLKRPHFQLWIALTEMNKNNGGIWIIPGSHSWDAIQHEKIHNHWTAQDIATDQAKCIIAQPGDAILFSSMMLHKTEQNRTQGIRSSYVVEYMRQQDFDPHIASPYLFLDNGPNWKKRHPSKKVIFKTRSLIPTEERKRTV